MNTCISCLRTVVLRLTETWRPDGGVHRCPECGTINEQPR